MQLEVVDLSIQFGGSAVIAHTNFEVTSPGLIALMGPSGSGKTSLLGALAGTIAPTSGHIAYKRAGDTFRPEISWVFQSSPTLARRSAFANVMLGALAKGRTYSEAYEKSVEAMNQLNIGSLADQRTSLLSGGERQRVSIAQGVAAGSDVLLVDEPTASLDATSRSAVCDALIRASQDADRIIVVATHDQFVADACNSTLHILSGTLVKTR